MHFMAVKKSWKRPGFVSYSCQHVKEILFAKGRNIVYNTKGVPFLQKSGNYVKCR